MKINYNLIISKNRLSRECRSGTPVRKNDTMSPSFKNNLVEKARRISPINNNEPGSPIAVQCPLNSVVPMKISMQN